jgi:type I restriction enzyme S subunit
MTEGGDFDKLGRGCVWSGEVTGCLHQNHVFAVRPDPRRLLPDFLAALTASATGRFYFTSTSQQSTNLATTSRTKVKALPIVLPPLPEQRAIVDFLDRETGRIDALIGKKRRLIELLEEKRSALISHAVTKGLDPDAPMKDSGIEWLGQIPAHWEVLCNRRLFSERVEANRPDLPILNVSIHTGVELRTFSESRIEQQCYDRTLYKVARRGDLAYNTMRMWQGAVGVAPVDGLVSPAYVVCGSTARVLPRYFELVYRTDYYRTEVNRYSYGIVPDRNRLYFERFAQMKAPVPPLSEQNHIVDSLSQQTGRMDQLVARNREAIDKLQEYRTALISAAVTGKIDVRREQV